MVLVAHWRFDETDGASAFDSSGNSRTGLINGGALLTPAKIGGGILLDGVDGHVSVASVIDNSVTTVMAWVKSSVAAGASREVYANAQDTCSLRWSDSGQSAEPSFTVQNTLGSYFTASTEAPLSADTWYHLAGTCDWSNARMYVNGVEAGSIGVTGSPKPVTGGTLIGVHSSVGANWFTGLIDDVRIYDHVLAPVEIHAIYISGASPYVTPDYESFPKSLLARAA